jgi:excisionase family DNA binding protein
MTPLLSIKEAARLLGVSPWTIRRLIGNAKLTPVQVGTRVLLEQATLERFISTHRGVGRDA